MKLRGNLVLLNKPVREESPLELSEESKAKLEADELHKWTHLEVFAVGDTVEDVKEGDIVFVNSSAIGNSAIVEIEGKVKLMLPSHSIDIIW